LLQQEQIASGYLARERFLTELTLDSPDATSDQAGVPSKAQAERANFGLMRLLALSHNCCS
jgi:hypothetical protein